MQIAPGEMALMPRWTVPSFVRTSGRYPLGLEAVALNQLATDLAAGLPVLSRHPRYWSIYTYLIKQYWDRKRMPQNNTALGRFIKTREIVFACAALLCPRHNHKPLLSIVGSRTFRPWLSDKQHTDIPISASGPLGAYIQSGMGGYGQIYRQAMSELGLILLAEDNARVRMDAPFSEIGVAVAQAFEAAIADTVYVRRHLDQDEGNVPMDVVRELGEVSCFCQLTHHAPEHDLLTQVLLGRVQAPTEAHQQRAETIHMFLDLAAKTANVPLSEERFRKLLYYGQDGAGNEWSPDLAVHNSWRRWWLIQLRQYAVGALYSLFIDLVHWGIDQGATLRPLQFSAYGERACTLPLPSYLGLGSRTLGDTTLHELADTLSRSKLEDGWPSAQARDLGLLSEAALEVDDGRSHQISAPVAALMTLLLVRQRLGAIRLRGYLEPTQGEHLLHQMVRDGDIDRWSVATISAWLDQRIDDNAIAADALADLVREMVIDQHLRVARSKLGQAQPEDTFRFHDDSDGLLFINHHDTAVNPISIRFDAISEAIYGLGLTKARLSEEGHALTERGWEIASGN